MPAPERHRRVAPRGGEPGREQDHRQRRRAPGLALEESVERLEEPARPAGQVRTGLACGSPAPTTPSIARRMRAVSEVKCRLHAAEGKRDHQRSVGRGEAQSSSPSTALRRSCSRPATNDSSSTTKAMLRPAATSVVGAEGCGQAGRGTRRDGQRRGRHPPERAQRPDAAVDPDLHLGRLKVGDGRSVGLHGDEVDDGTRPALGGRREPGAPTRRRPNPAASTASAARPRPHRARRRDDATERPMD